MAKITLEFDAIEEAQEVQTAINGSKWKALVWDLDQKLRQTTKYRASAITEGKEARDIEVEIADRYREVLRELMIDYGLTLD
jgi:ubiquinone biosynthesis protein UbiJ